MALKLWEKPPKSLARDLRGWGFAMSKHITKYISPYFNRVREDDTLVLTGVVAGIKRNDLSISSNNEGFILKVHSDPTWDTSVIPRWDDSDIFDFAAAKAKLEDGLLTIRVPQRQEKKPRQISIE